ncbi:hypothetical protein Fcan01_25962 [Folsomia candida]|uniref:Uncharacterized protein n=1 Tax=Folsomia candida TaxID=158441 RepID=A0A226D186_FOLCA|nr:hypothetical protein Fcan01_25962 [Folsomia candida]
MSQIIQNILEFGRRQSFLIRREISSCFDFYALIKNKILFLNMTTFIVGQVAVSYTECEEIRRIIVYTVLTMMLSLVTVWCTSKFGIIQKYFFWLMNDEDHPHIPRPHGERNQFDEDIEA